MLVCVHGLFQSAGVFLPLLRSMVGNNSKFSDKFLVDSFCLWIPGYDKKDREFDYKYIEQEILEFAAQKKQAQLEIAEDSIISSNRPPVEVFKSPKINLLGCDVGASVCLDFAAHNPELVGSIVIADCGSGFGGWRAKWLIYTTNRLLSQNSPAISNKLAQEKSIYKKNFLSNILNYPAAKGIKSYLKIYQSYNFESIFNKITLEQQNQFAKIKILSLVDKKNGLSNNSSILKFQKILHQRIKTKSKDKVIIENSLKQNLQIKPVSLGTSSILDTQVASKIADVAKAFYTSI